MTVALHLGLAASLRTPIRLVCSDVDGTLLTPQHSPTARTIDTVERGDLAVFRTAGAYGATMANTYNSRPLVPEVMVDGDKWAVVADRIDPATILAAERVPDFLK